MSVGTLEPVIWAAVVTNGLTLMAVTGAAIAVMVLVLGLMGRNLEQLAESLPKLSNVLAEVELDIGVLISMCEAKGTSATELAALFRTDADRASVVNTRFGTQFRLTRRFLHYRYSRFLASGYPQERFLTEFLNTGAKSKDPAPTPDAGEEKVDPEADATAPKSTLTVDKFKDS